MYKAEPASSKVGMDILEGFVKDLLSLSAATKYHYPAGTLILLLGWSQ